MARAKKTTATKAPSKSKAKLRQEMEIPQDIEINEVELVEFANSAAEKSQKAKQITADGIDLVTKGTNFKSRAQQMMKEGKAAMTKAEELFAIASALSTDSNSHSNLSSDEVNEVARLSAEREDTRKKLLDLDRKIKKLKDSSEKNSRTSVNLSEDSIEKFETAERLKTEANKLFSEASKYSEEGQLMINEGNSSLERAKEISNSSLKEVTPYSEADFTREIKVDLTQEQAQPSNEEK